MAVSGSSELSWAELVQAIQHSMGAIEPNRSRWWWQKGEFSRRSVGPSKWELEKFQLILDKWGEWDRIKIVHLWTERRIITNLQWKIWLILPIGGLCTKLHNVDERGKWFPWRSRRIKDVSRKYLSKPKVSAFIPLFVSVLYFVFELYNYANRRMKSWE